MRRRRSSRRACLQRLRSIAWVGILRTLRSHVNAPCVTHIAKIDLMAIDTPASRLVWARKHHGKYNIPTDAARAFGWTVSTYLGHENGDRNPSRAAAKKYARAYHVRWEWLLDADGEPLAPIEARVTPVRLISWVSAGGLADAQSQIPVEESRLLAFSDLGQGQFFALQVVGDSMDRVSPEGSVIVVNRADRVLIPDKPYVFLHRGETTFKLWRANPDHLAPHSWSSANKPIFLKGKRDFEVIGRVRRTVLDL